jgi:hypothetical protein
MKKIIPTLKKSFKYLIILLAGMALVLNSCKEDCPSCQDPTNPDCDNYDPCWNKQPVTADFEISQQPVTFYPDYIGDWHPDLKFFRSLIGFRPVNFIEGDTSVKYTWLLGSEVVHDYYLERDFSDTEQSGENNIRITLIVEKEPDLDCFPLDDGKDTITKYIQLVENACEFLTFGDFKVLFEGDRDSTLVSVRNWRYDNNGTFLDSCGGGYAQFINFDNLKSEIDTIRDQDAAGSFYSKRWFYESKVGEGRFGNLMNGKFAINPDTWECEAEYQVNYRPLGPVQRFKGRKIR